MMSMPTRSTSTLNWGYWPWLMAALALLITVPFTAEEQIRDSLYWARIVEEGTNWYAILNPHHLIYLPLDRLLYVLLHPFCSECGGIAIGKLHSLIASAAAVAGFYMVVFRLTSERLLALSMGLLLLLTEVVWVYSSQVEPYTPLIACLVFLVFVLAGDQAFTRRGLLAAAFWFALAVLYHQAMVVLALPLFLYALVVRGRRGVADTAFLLGVAGALVLAGYLAAYGYLYGDLSPRGFVEYCLRYSTIPDPTYATFSNYTWPRLSLLLLRHFQGFIVLPWGLHKLAPLIYLGALLALAAWTLRQIARRAPHREVRVLCLSWVVLLVALYLWTNPDDKESLLLYVVPLLLLLSLGMADLLAAARGRKGLRSALFAGLIGAVVVVGARNFTETVYPMAKQKGAVHAWAAQLHAAVPSQCLAIHQDQPVLQHLTYYFHRPSADLWDIVTYFLYGQKGGVPFSWQGFRFSSAPCYGIPVATILPGASVRGHTGYTRPREWLGFMAWLFDLRVQDGRVVSARPYRIAVDAGGRAYFILSPKAEASGLGLDAWFAEIDHRLAQGQGKPSDQYSRWFRTMPRDLEPLCGALCPKAAP